MKQSSLVQILRNPKESAMKKRKSPILLVSLLVVCVGAVVVMGMAQLAGNAPTPQNPDQYMAGDTHQAPSKDEVAKNLKAATDAAKPKEPGSAMDPKMARNSVPLIATAPDKAAPAEKPKYDPSTTVGNQWYRDNHR